MAELPVADDLIAPSITEAEFKAALKILVENVASKDWVNLNALFKPIIVLANQFTNIDQMAVSGHYIITSDTFAAAIAGLPESKAGFIDVMANGNFITQKYSPSFSNYHYIRTSNIIGSFPAFEKIAGQTYVDANIANLTTMVGLVNSALVNASTRPNMFSEEQNKFNLLPTSNHTSALEKVSIYGKDGLKITANSAGSYPNVASAQWTFNKTVVDFPSGFLSAQVTIDAANAGTGSTLTIVQRDGANATLSTTVIAPSQLLAIIDSQTFYVSGIAVNPSVATVQIYLRMDGTARTFTLSNLMLADGKSGYWRNPVLSKKSVTLNMFPNTFLTSAKASIYQATKTVESGYDVAVMNSSGTAQIFYDFTATSLYQAGDTLTFAADVYTDTANTGVSTNSADIAIVFLNAAGATIGTITAVSSSAANTWNRLSTVQTIPAGTDKIRLRFVKRSAISVAKFRAVSLLTNNSAAAVFAPASIGADGTSISFKNAYVATTGSDSTGDGTATMPFATLAKAISTVSPFGRVIVAEGDYLQAASWNGVTQLEITAAENARVRIIGGTKLTSITKTIGQTKIYQAALANAPTVYVWQHDVPDERTLIPMAERHTLQRGQTHRLTSSKISPAASIAAIDAASDAQWFWESGVLYFSIAGGGDATSANIYVPAKSASVLSGGTGSEKITMQNITTLYSYRGIDVSRLSSWTAIGCKALFATTVGFCRDDTRSIKERLCEAAGCGIDGFNTHRNQANAYQENLNHLCFDNWSHDNNDDGDSMHENCVGTYYGGLYEYNGDRGIATAYGAHSTHHNALSRYNGKTPGTTFDGGEGFASIGTLSKDTGVGTSMILHNCVAIGNVINYRADNQSNNSLTAINCKSIDPVTDHYRNDGGSMLLRDCGSLGSGTIKAGVGVITVQNTSIVT